jgi:glycosyltransferase involved in cell wall biosynthesis
LFLIGSTRKAAYARECLLFEYSLKNRLLKQTFESRFSIIANNVLPGYGFLRSRLSLSGDRAIGKHISKFLTENKVDLVYSFPWYPESYLSAVKRTGKPLVVAFMEDQICFRYGGLTRIIPKKHACKEAERGYAWLRHVIDMADHIVVPSSVFRDRLEKLGADMDNISVVPVCTHPLISERPEIVRARWKISPETKVIYYLGSISWYHDLKSVLDALNETKRKDIVLIISGGWKGSFKKYAPLIEKIKTKVIYTGIVSSEDLDQYLALADVCVGAYEFEYPCGFFPATVVRYMLAGKAIIATDLPEIREMFKGSEAGLLVRQNDSQQIAKAIDFLLDNEKERTALGATAQKIAGSNYLWAHHTVQVNKVFEKVLRRHG